MGRLKKILATGALTVALLIPAVSARADVLNAAADAVALKYPHQVAQFCEFASTRSFEDTLAVFRPYYHDVARQYALPRHPRAALTALLGEC